MRRRVTGLLLWCGLLLAVGTIRLLGRTLRTVVWLRFREAMAVVGLIVVATTSNPLSVRVQESAAGPAGHVVVLAGALLLGVAVVYHGFRSSIRPRLSGRSRRRAYDPRAADALRRQLIERHARWGTRTIRRP
jgi:hypothetical protein